MCNMGMRRVLQIESRQLDWKLMENEPNTQGKQILAKSNYVSGVA